MELLGARGHGTGLMQVEESKMVEGDGIVSVKKEELIGVGKEVASLLKTIRCLCVCILVVMLLNVCVNLIK